MQKTRKLVLVGLFAALAIIVGYMLISIPNVELVMATIFIGGFYMGRSYGVIIGMVSELILTMTNPLGPAAPPLAMAQIFSMMLVGLTGGWLSRYPFWHKSHGLRFPGFGLVGLMLTMVYDFLTTLSFAPIIAGWQINKIIGIFLAGIPFTLTHWLANFLIFTLLVPVLINFMEKSKLLKSSV